MHPRLFPLALILGVATAALSQAAQNPDWSFNLIKVSEAHLSFVPGEWRAIRRAEPARRSSGGVRSDLGSFLAPAFLRELDADQDGRISREEFLAGFARWMQEWDTKHQGFLDGDALRDGIDKALRLGPTAAPASPPPSPAGAPASSLTTSPGHRNSLSGINFEFVHGKLDLDGRKFDDVGVRYKGRGTSRDAGQTEKKSFKVVLNHYVTGQKLGEISRLNFHNNLADPSSMNEALAQELYRAAGVPSMHTAYARLFLTVPGMFAHQYLGLYSICEDPDRNWADDNFLTRKGLILKPSTRELFIDQGDDWSAYAQAYDARTVITDKEVHRVHEFAKLVTTAKDDKFARRLPEFLDLDEFTRFMAVTVWLSSTDSILMMGQNFVIYLDPKSKKFSFIPWEADHTLGNSSLPQPEQLSIHQAWTYENRFLRRVMNVPEVHAAYLARLEEFQQTIFQPEKLQRRVDELSTLIRPAVAEEGPEELQRFDLALSRPDAVAPASAPDGPTPASEPATPAVAAAPPSGDARPGPPKIRYFIAARYQSVADQLAGKSQGIPLGRPGPGRGAGDGARPPGDGRGKEGFGIGMFLGPAVIEAADAGADHHITSEKFAALAERWFKEWDTDADGSLSAEELKQGLNKAFQPPRPPGP